MLASSGEIGAGRVKVRPAPKAAPESLENSGLLYPQMLTPHPPVFPHISPLFFLPCGLGAGHGAVAPPPVREKGPPADRTGPGFRGGPLGIEGGLQHRVQRQDGLPEVAAVSPRPAFPQHIALAVKGQTAIFPVIVGAPFHYKGADSGLFLTGQLAQNITSRPAFSKGSESRSRRGCRASRDSHSTGSPPGAVPGGEPGAGGGVSFPVPKGSM